MQVHGKVIRTTGEHPFYVWGKGWTAAKDLLSGDRLRGHDGRMMAVQEAHGTGVEEVVYNCAVEEYHTYFVGGEDWGFSVWAHNACDITGARSAAQRNGGRELAGDRFAFPTREAARQAASELAGNLGPGTQAIRLSEFRGGPWWTKNSNRVIGRQSADGSAGWRDDFLGHHSGFEAGPHVNVWGPGGAQFHLFY